ncbi:unnamed protein product [Effrenium voratum]|nr:unnamed protein product [Effrenium voratum]
MEGLPPWQPHTGSIAAPLSDGSMLLKIGGQAGRHGGANFDCFNCTNEVWHFKHQTAEWKNLTEDVPWDPRWGHSVITKADDTVMLFFGCCERGKPTVMLRDVWSFNPLKGLGWSKMETQPPFEGIQATSAALTGSHIWFVGGWSQFRGTLSQVVVFDLDTLKWIVKSKEGEAPWDSRADHATAISPDGAWLVMFGGQHAKDQGRQWKRCEDTWRVPLPSGLASEWQRIGDLPSARSSPGVMVLRSGWLITLGGHWTPPTEKINAKNQADREAMEKHHEETEFKSYNDVVALDLNTASKAWTILEKEAPWPSRDDVAVGVTVDDTILIFGGGTMYGGGGYHQDVWRLEKASQRYRLSKPQQEL